MNETREEFRERPRLVLDISLNYSLQLSLLPSGVLINFQGNAVDASSEREITKNELFFVSDKRLCIGSTTYSLQNISSVNLSEFLHKPNTTGWGTMAILVLMGTPLFSLGGFMIILGVVLFLFLYFINTIEQRRVKSGTFAFYKVKISDSSGQKNVFETRSKQDAELLVESINQAMIVRL